MRNIEKVRKNGLRWYHRNSAILKSRRDKDIASGICFRCRKRDAVRPRQTCDICAKRSAATAIALRAKQERGFEKKRKLVELKGGKCVDCGWCGHQAGFEFDHLRDKLHNISDMIGAAAKWDNILIEVDKCDLVCATCHRIRTYVRKYKQINNE